MTKTDEFTELLRTYGDTAWRMALHLTKGNEPEARDLVQDAFIRIWRYWGFQKPDHFKSWMYRILHNLYMDECRRRQRRPTVSLDASHPSMSDGIAWEDQLEEKRPQPQVLAESHDVQAVVQAALHRLP